jgi:hypothetical protein
VSRRQVIAVSILLAFVLGVVGAIFWLFSYLMRAWWGGFIFLGAIAAIALVRWASGVIEEEL